MKKYKSIDLFCGCGGLSIGFGLTGRFESVLGWDNFSAALEVFKSANQFLGASPIIVDKDIKANTLEVLRSALAKANIKPGDIDCVVGGPPCEGFSQNRSLGSGGDWRNGGGKRIDKFIDDPRNVLFRFFMDVVGEIKPKVVLIENVPAIIRHKDGQTLREVFDLLRSFGYVGTAEVLNSANHGVPQMRHRAFILACRVDDKKLAGFAPSLPTPSHRPFELATEKLDKDVDWMPGDSGYWPSVREAIGDLPEPTKDDDYDHVKARFKEPAVSELRTFLRSRAVGVPFNHILRQLGAGGLKRVKALRSRQRADDLPDELRPRSYFHYSYSRLVWSDPARTITKFAYHVGSGMFAHPDEDRGITMREAARLQTFPDWVRFDCNRIRDLSAMIGNAVPPLLARKIGVEISRYLDALTFRKLSPSQLEKYYTQKSDAVIRRMIGEEFNGGDDPQYPLVLIAK